MTDLSQIFKLYDIRVRHDEISHGGFVSLVAAMARYFRDEARVARVVVCRDARLHSAGLMDLILDIFPRFGLDVLFNPGQISTCQFYFTCMRSWDCGGVMITASHNPGEYVGFKIVGPGVCPVSFGTGIEKIMEGYLRPEPVPAAGARGRTRVVQRGDEYIDYSMRLAGVGPGSLEGLRVYAEFLSGTAGADIITALDAAGAAYDLSHAVPDGFFPAGNPNPIEEKSVAPSREAVRKGNYDLGFCFDGDGDRMDLMYPDGSQIIPGLNISLLIPYIDRIFRPFLGPDRPLSAFADARSVPLSLAEISKAGVRQHIIRNGHSFIKAKLRERARDGYMMCEEESAHYYLNFPLDPGDLSKGFAATENTLFFALLTAKAAIADREGYLRIRRIQDGIHRVREWPLRFKGKAGMAEVLAQVEACLRARGAVVVDRMDDGSSLEATIMRLNLPAAITADTVFPEKWCQVAQRISCSEDFMTRWEVVSSDEAFGREVNSAIVAITDRYVDRGLASY